MMRIAVGLPQLGDDPVACVHAAQRAEEAGAWGVFVFDHLAPPWGGPGDVLDGWSVLAQVARATSEVRLVSLVTRAGLRPAALVGRMAATVQDASAGRLVVGLGVGDAGTRAEEARFGAPGARDRSAALRETAERVREMSDGPPSIWVGGRGPRVRDLAAEVADAWHAWEADPSELAGMGTPEAWWGGIYRASTASDRTRALVDAGWAGITWWVSSEREGVDRRRLLGSL